MITFDGLFLGRLGADALAGVSLAFPFVMLIQHTAASGMGGGVASAIARALGAGKRDVADALVLHTFVLALGLAAAFTGVLLLGAPSIFRLDGRAWRDAVGRARLRERGVQRRDLDLHAEPARQRRARHRQYGPARRGHRRQRDRPCSHFAFADFRLGAGAGPWSCRRRLGPDAIVRRRQPGAARLSAFVPLACHLAFRASPCAGRCSPRSSRSACRG